MERSRITPRLRPRPHDLRRKVLLKNFLREQMTYIPQIRSTAETSIDVNNDLEINENESNSNTNEGNILTPKNIEDNIVTLVSVPEPTASTSNCSEKENSNNSESSSNQPSSDMNESEQRPSKFSRLSRIMETIDSRLSVRKNRRKGITKAKHELRSSKGLLKPAERKIIKDSEVTTKPKTKTFFERFKSRKDKKRNKSTTSRISNLFGSRNSSPNKCHSKVTTTSTQSVQTDASWAPDHYEKMEQSNRSLLEENRLLSESLSSIITNKADFISSSLQKSCCTDSYTNNIDNSSSYFNPEPRPVNRSFGNEGQYLPDSSSRTRILRSKSMQNRSDKRYLASSRLPTRSSTFRYAKKPYNADSFFINEPHLGKAPYRVHPIVNPVPSRAKLRPSVLQSIVTPPLCQTNISSLPKTLPNKSSKALTRRSSMPERTYNWSYRARPIRSSSMRESNRYSYSMSERLSNRPASSHRRRPTSFNGYSYSVPFQDLPAEAFY